jgi:hypothetical protein
MTPAMHIIKRIKLKVGISLKMIRLHSMQPCYHDKKLVNAEFLLSAKLQMHLIIQFKMCSGTPHLGNCTYCMQYAI